MNTLEYLEPTQVEALQAWLIAGTFCFVTVVVTLAVCWAIKYAAKPD